MMIKKGAEAEVIITDNIVIKNRSVKNYRESQLDNKIRRERNKREARIMIKVAQKVNIPKIIEYDKFSIKMEFINGEELKNKESLKGVEKRIGEQIGLLHSLGISHGDLTTSNIILKNKKIYLIDFGLANRGKIEDFATDIKVLFECVRASHSDFSKKLFFEGYNKKMSKHKEVKSRLEKVYERGRYRIKQSQ